MPRRPLHWFRGACWPAFLVALLFGNGASGRSQDPQSAEALLSSVTNYLAGYDTKFSAVVSDERYLQTILGPSTTIVSTRELRSEVLLVNAGRAGWLCYRDVYAVDGKQVRGRTSRVMTLFVKPSENDVIQAARIREEGARFNLGSIRRTINEPTLALSFLRPEHQPRSSFEVAGGETIAGQRTRILKFREHTSPRLIDSGDGSPASGRFWIDADTGRIVRTELLLSSYDVRGVVTVTFGPSDKLAGLWVPLKMEEHYAGGSAQTLRCTATYENFRQFKVDASTIIK